MIRHVDVSTVRSVALMPKTRPTRRAQAHQNDYRTTGNTGNSKEWPEGLEEVAARTASADPAAHRVRCDDGRRRKETTGGKGGKGGNLECEDGVREGGTGVSGCPSSARR